MRVDAAAWIALARRGNSSALRPRRPSFVRGEALTQQERRSRPYTARYARDWRSSASLTCVGVCHTLSCMTPSPGRPHVLTLRITDAELERLDEFAERLGFSRSESVRQLLRVGMTAVNETKTDTGVLALLTSLDRTPQRKRRRKR